MYVVSFSNLLWDGFPNRVYPATQGAQSHNTKTHGKYFHHLSRLLSQVA